MIKKLKKLKHLAGLSALILSVSLILCSCSAIPTNSTKPTDKNVTDVVIDSTKELSVHFIDVGQADCILIELPDGENIMIDAGNRDDFETISSYLSEQSVEKLDYMVLTHPHEDHIGSAAEVIKKYSPSKIYMPETAANTKVFENTLLAIAESGADMISAVPGDYIINDGDLSMEILAPAGDDYDTQNDYSVVTKLTYDERSFLFTGDAEEKAENDILSTKADLSADVLKVGHHGSVTSTSDDFLNAVKPEYSVIMCGVGNEYGHPHWEIIEKLEKANSAVFRTDTQGTIVCRTDGENIAFNTQPYDNSNSNSNTDTQNSQSTSSQEEDSTDVSQAQFIGNKNSKIFHTLDCNNNMSEKNKVYFSTYEEAEEAGYKPCSNCNPQK